MLHASGIADRWGVEKSMPRALVHWQFAAGADNVYASLALGFRYMSGVDVPKNCQVAARYYQRAASAIATDPRYWPGEKNFQFGDPPLSSSLVQVGRTRLREDMFKEREEQGGGARRARRGGEEEERFHYYTHLAERGSVESMAMLGSLLLTGGLGVDADARRAREYLTNAAAMANGEAHGIMGHLEMRKGNYTGAMLHFAISAEHMDRIGHYALGMVSLHGLLGMDKNFRVAEMHFLLAVKHKHAEACFQLAMMHWEGQGVERNPMKAFEFFEKAAKWGNIQSKLNVARILLEGAYPAKRKDCETAVLLMKEVAEEGEWNTLFDLASSTFEKKDWYGSLYRHLEAAHAGIELGQYNSAMILEKLAVGEIKELAHWSRERMVREMHELYHMSGRQNRSDAYMRSGDVAYVERKDYATALMAYNQSANLQNPEGIFAVGMMYANGQGIKSNRELALEHFARVARRGAQPAMAANLAVIGLKFYWWLCDVREWWNNVDKSARLEAVGDHLQDEAHQNWDGASDASVIKPSSSTRVKVGTLAIGDDLAIMGGLLVILITILVVRSRRIARLSGNADGTTHPSDVH